MLDLCHSPYSASRPARARQAWRGCGVPLLQGDHQMMRVQRATCRFPWLLSALVLAWLVALPTMAGTRHANTRTHADHATATANDAGKISGSTVAELKQLMSSDKLTELRTTYNGTYGASLLFYADKLTYYVVLFHHKDFWRVIRTEHVDEAEKVYATFAKQSRKLAQVDIDTIRLQAGKKYTQHLLSVNQQRLQKLHADLQRQQSQAQQIAQDQQKSKQEAISLTQTLHSSSAQLEQLRQQIEALKQRQADLQMQLPPAQQPAPSSTSSPASPNHSPEISQQAEATRQSRQ